MESIKALLVLHKEINNEACSQSYRKTKDVDKGIERLMTNSA
jgi:hypothetical protein